MLTPRVTWISHYFTLSNLFQRYQKWSAVTHGRSCAKITSSRRWRIRPRWRKNSMHVIWGEESKWRNLAWTMRENHVIYAWFKADMVVWFWPRCEVNINQHVNIEPDVITWLSWNCEALNNQSTNDHWWISCWLL